MKIPTWKSAAAVLVFGAAAWLVAAPDSEAQSAPNRPAAQAGGGQSAGKVDPNRKHAKPTVDPRRKHAPPKVDPRRKHAKNPELELRKKRQAQKAKKAGKKDG